MTVTLSASGAAHYPRKSRRGARGVVLGELPSGAVIVEWPWGIGINLRHEVAFS